MTKVIIPTEGEPECSCGRIRDRIHCPSCGFYTVYGFAKRESHMGQDGLMHHDIKVYRCKRCSLVFNDLDRNKCEAPFFQTKSMAERRSLDKARSAMETIVNTKYKGDRSAYIKDLFAQEHVQAKIDLARKGHLASAPPTEGRIVDAEAPTEEFEERFPFLEEDSQGEEEQK